MGGQALRPASRPVLTMVSYAIGGLERKYSAHIFTAKTFVGNRDLDLVTFYQFIVNDGRYVILRIYQDQRSFDHRFMQIAIPHIPDEHFR